MRYAAILLATAALCGESAAQNSAPTNEPASIPTELARALVLGPFGEGTGSVRFFVGAPPGALPAGLALPSGARIVGGQAFRRGTTTVVAVNGPSATVVDSLRASLGRAGWTTAQMEPQRGFIMTGPRGGGAVLCRDSAIVMIFAAGGAKGSSYLTVSHRARDRYDACAQRPADDRFTRDLDVPPLQPPTGARTVGGGTGGGNGDLYASIRVETSLTPDALVAHYARQLGEAGWTLGAALAGKDLAIVPLEARDSRGQQWRGMISALSWPADSVKRVDLRMMRPDDR